MPNIEKCLGKITFAEFGTMGPDYPDYIGLQLGFSISGMDAMSGSKYTVNINPKCRYEEGDRSEAIALNIEMLAKILQDAKANYVSELINKPVEVTLEARTFKDFRILTEVL